jgi:excisionase family DNA binding protein
MEHRENKSMSDKLTVAEAAELLGYHENHVRRLLRSGVIKAEQFSRIWIIDRSEVERVKALQSKGGRFYPDREGQSIDQD